MPANRTAWTAQAQWQVKLEVPTGCVPCWCSPFPPEHLPLCAAWLETRSLPDSPAHRDRQSHSAGILVCAEHVFERPRDMQRERTATHSSCDASICESIADK
jgi:hypothetical protein